MFFSVAQQAQDNYPCHWQLGQLTLSTDRGWHQYKDSRYHAVYKGYIENASIHDTIKELVNAGRFKGNFCAIVHDAQQQQVTIRSDVYRGFPIYVHGDQITNLQRSDKVVWTDGTVAVNTDMTYAHIHTDVIGHVDSSPIELEQAIQSVHDLLVRKARNFVEHNRLPIKVYLSGGVDSLLVYAYLKHVSDDFEIVRCSHVDHDWFWLMNSGLITQHWGYRQIHHWEQPCVLTSGAPGDEFMLRSPTTVNLWLMYHGISMIDLLSMPEWQHCLHWQYYHKPVHQEIFRQRLTTKFDNKKHMIWQLCNININDWQHWHLGNTLTWTPLRDLDIFKILVRLDVQDALPQIMNSAISLRLIDMVNPGLSHVISAQKNHGNLMANLVKLFYP